MKVSTSKIAIRKIIEKYFHVIFYLINSREVSKVTAIAMIQISLTERVQKYEAFVRTLNVC